MISEDEPWHIQENIMIGMFCAAVLSTFQQLDITENNNKLSMMLSIDP